MLAPEPEAMWGIDFARADGTGGFLRLVRVRDRCWCWAYLVGPELGFVVVRDHDVAPPRRPEILDVRAEGLWMELVCETPGEHWTYGLEAFGVRLDDVADALRGEVGERLPVGLDLEWETDVSGNGPTGWVHGELLVADERIELEAAGVLYDARYAAAAWPTEWTGACRLDDGRWVRPSVVATEPFDAGGLVVPTRWASDAHGAHPMEPLAVVPVPFRVEASLPGPVLVRVLTRVHDIEEGSGIGWLEVLQSGDPT